MNEFYSASDKQVEDCLLSCFTREVNGDDGYDSFVSVAVPVKSYCLKPNFCKLRGFCLVEP